MNRTHYHITLQDGTMYSLFASKPSWAILRILLHCIRHNIQHLNQLITIKTYHNMATNKENKGMSIAKRMEAIRSTDKSFTKPENWFTRILGIHGVSQEEAREIWLKGIEIGMIEGILLSGNEPQSKPQEDISRLKAEFLQKYLELSHRYGYGVRYDKLKGIDVVELRTGVCVKDSMTA